MAKIKIKIVRNESASQIIKKRNTWDGNLYEKYYKSSAVAYVDNRIAISIVELMEIERFLAEYKLEYGDSSLSEGDFYDDGFEEYNRTYCISAKKIITLLNRYRINEYVEVDEDLEFSIFGQNNSIESELDRIEKCQENEINAVIAKWNSLKTLFWEGSIISNRISPVEKCQSIGYPFCWGVKNCSRKIIDACIANPLFSEEQYEHLAQVEDVKDSHVNQIIESIFSINDSSRQLKHLELLRLYLQRKRAPTDNIFRKVDAEVHWIKMVDSIINHEYSKTADYVLILCQCSVEENFIAILINIYNTRNDFYLSLRHNSFWHRHALDIMYIRENMCEDLCLALQVPIAKCYKNKYGKKMPQELFEICWDSAPQVFPEEIWTDDMGIPF